MNIKIKLNKDLTEYSAIYEQKCKSFYNSIYKKYFERYQYFIDKLPIQGISFKYLCYLVEDEQQFHITVYFSRTPGIEKIQIDDYNYSRCFDLFPLLINLSGDDIFSAFLKSDEGQKAIFDSFNMVFNQYVLEETKVKAEIEADKVKLEEAYKSLSPYLQ